MRKAVVILLAVLAGMARAGDGRGAIEGTVTGQDNHGLQGVAVEIESSVPGDGDSFHVRRFKVKTDERGHFIHSGLPQGTYSVSVLGPSGEVVRRVAELEVQTGTTLSIGPKLAGIPPFAGKKQPKASAALAQADIIKGCIAIRGIVFQRFRFLRSGAQVQGLIVNTCGREVRISVGVEMFDSTGSSVYLNIVDKLVTPGSLGFGAGPEYDSRESYVARSGRVTSVVAGALP